MRIYCLGISLIFVTVFISAPMVVYVSGTRTIHPVDPASCHVPVSTSHSFSTCHLYTRSSFQRECVGSSPLHRKYAQHIQHCSGAPWLWSAGVHLGTYRRGVLSIVDEDQELASRKSIVRITNVTCDHIDKLSKRTLRNGTDGMQWVPYDQSR